MRNAQYGATITESPTPAEVIAQALALNAETLADDAAMRAGIEAGTAVVSVYTASVDSSRRYRCVATLGVRFTATDGGQAFAPAADPRLVHLNTSRNFTPDRMATWWAAKNYGHGIAVLHRTHV